MTTPAPAQACKVHSDRAGGVQCQRCGAAMCPSCMHQASVGWHCPDCVRDHRRETRPQRQAVKRAMGTGPTVVTIGIIAACCLVFLADMAMTSGQASAGRTGLNWDLLLYAPFVDSGEWYRVISAAFAHGDLLHIGFNMYLLWALGRPLEARFGWLGFATMYVAGVLGGSLGAMLVEPRASVLGASGGVFALMGVFAVLQGARGLQALSNGIGPLIVLNVLLSFRGGVSLGGHVGGLLAGLAMGGLLLLAQRRGRRYEQLAPIGFAAVGLICLVALIPAIDRAVGLI